MALGGDRGLGVGPPWRLTWAGPWESREEAGFSSVWDTGRPRRQQCPPGLHSRGQPAEGPGLTLEAPPSPGSGGREWASGRGGGASIPWLPWESPHTLQPQTTLISTGQFWRTEAQTGHTVPGRSGLWRSSHSLASGPFLSGPCTRRPGAPAPSDALSPASLVLLQGAQVHWESCEGPGRPLGTWRPQEGGDRPQAASPGIRLLWPQSVPAPALVPSVQGRRLPACAVPPRWLLSAEGERERGLGPGRGGCGWRTAWALRRAHQSSPWRARPQGQSPAEVPGCSGHSAYVTENGSDSVAWRWEPSSASGPAAPRGA